jgi:thioredoxin reductase
MSFTYDLAIVGAGLSGLNAIASGLGEQRVLLLDYQDAPGGFLRSALPMPGFEAAWETLRTLHLPGEVSACYGATAVGLLPALDESESHALVVRQRQGTSQIHARLILIACGGLEATREHAQIPGTRPAGVMTPILAHQMLARGYLPGKHAIVYGDARYARATAERLQMAGMDMTLISPSEGVPVRVEGFPRLERVVFRNVEGHEFGIDTDVFVYGAGMLANTHWLKGSGVETTPEGAIVVDERYQTTIPGIFAVGTVVRPSLDHADSLAMGKEVAILLRGGVR